MMVFDDHKIIEEQGIVEKYALGELSPDEEEAFEEHLLFCEECRKNYNVISDIINGSGASAVSEIFAQKDEKRSGRKSGYFILKIAAGIALVIGIAAVIFFSAKIKQNNSQLASVADSTLTKNDTVDISPLHEPKEITEPHKVESVIKEEKKLTTDQYAEAFVELPYMETAIENQLRGDGVTILLPANSTTFKPGDAITFSWKSESSVPFTLVIKNNKGTILIEAKVTAPYKTSELKHPGLYYWQLNSEDETIYCGKFFICNN